MFVFKTRLWSWDALGIEIYRKGEKEAFQKIEMECEKTFENQIHMEDYNADGYLDFAVKYAEDGCGFNQRGAWSECGSDFALSAVPSFYGPVR